MRSRSIMAAKASRSLRLHRRRPRPPRRRYQRPRRAPRPPAEEEPRSQAGALSDPVDPPTPRENRKAPCSQRALRTIITATTIIAPAAGRRSIRPEAPGRHRERSSQTAALRWFHDQPSPGAAAPAGNESGVRRCDRFLPRKGSTCRNDQKMLVEASERPSSRRGRRPVVSGGADEDPCRPKRI